MKKYLALIALSFIFMLPAKAANTPPPGTNNQLTYNHNGRYGTLGLNTGLYIINCPAGNYLSLTTTDCPAAPPGTFLTSDDGVTILTDDHGNQLTNN
jgi:hypothetical protein